MDVFREGQIFLKQSLDDKQAVLSFCAEKIAASQGIKAEKILHELQQREEKGSTAVGGGIAIPHCGLSASKHFSLVMLSTEQALEYKAFDNQPCQLFFCIVGPEADRGTHVRILSTLTVGLSKPQAYERLLAEKDVSIFKHLLFELMELEEAKSTAVASETREKLLRVELYCQKEQLFQRLLEDVSSCSVSSPLIVEAANAGNYLRTLPLYAMLWSKEQEHRFLRLIVAIIKDSDYSKLLREVQRTNKKKQGVMMLAQELEHVYGGLEY